MSRRAVRRQYAILGALHEYGPQFEGELCARLRRWPGTLYPDLSTLEAESLIVGEWEERDGDGPRRRRYRITSGDERERRQRISRDVELAIADRVAARKPPRRRVPILRPDGGAM